MNNAMKNTMKNPIYTPATAPRFILATDYTADYKPQTIDAELLECCSTVKAAMKIAESRYDESKVYCMLIFEKIDRPINGKIAYVESLGMWVFSGGRGLWRVSQEDPETFYYTLDPETGEIKLEIDWKNELGLRDA